MARDPFHCLPKTEAGCIMPAASTIIANDAATRRNAAEGSRQLLIAMYIYGARNGGLPNISQAECERWLGS